jgi:DNA-binding beta-propeller fold protein YncE
VTQCRQERPRPARRRSRLVRASAVIVALAALGSGLAAARYAVGWWAGPRSIGVGTQGADALAVSPDGKTLYAANWDGDGDSGGITVVDVATGRAGRRIDTGGPVVKLAMMPGGRALYALVQTGDNGDRVVRIGLAAGQSEERAAFRFGAADVVAAPTGSLLYVLAGTSRVSTAVIPVDADSGREGKAVQVPADAQAMAISPDGRMLYIGTGNADGKGPGEVISVDTSSGGTAGKPVRFPHPVIGLAVSPGGGRLFGLSSDYRCSDGGACGGRCDLVGIGITNGAALGTSRLDSGCDQIEVAPDGRRLFVLSTDNSLVAANALTGQIEKTIRTTGFIAGEGDSDFLIAPGGHTVYVADQYRGVAVINVP